MVELYVARKSVIHALPFFVKALAVCAAVTALYFTSSLFALSLACAASFLVYVLARLPFSSLLRCLRFIVPVLAVICLYRIASGAYALAAESALRIAAAVLLANAVSLTTPLSRIVAESERAFFFLRAARISPRLPGVAAGVFVRILPLLYLEKEEMDTAAALRGYPRRKKILQKIWRAKNPRPKPATARTPRARAACIMIFSLLLRAVLHAESMALALHLRGFSVRIKK